MICRQCGREISPPAGACPFCHSQVQTAASLAAIPNCPSCGEPTSYDRLRCAVCGFDRAVEPTLPCGNCSRTVAASARFCWSCGTPLALPGPRPPAPQVVPVPPAPPGSPAAPTLVDETAQTVVQPLVPPPPGPPVPPAPPPMRASEAEKVEADQTLARPLAQPPAQPPTPPPAPFASTGAVPPAPPRPAVPVAPVPPPQGPPPMAVPTRMSPLPAPPPAFAASASRPAKTRLLPVLLGVGLVLFLMLGAGAFAFWKFYWVPRSQQAQTADQSLDSQGTPASNEQPSPPGEQTSSPTSEWSQPIETNLPAENQQSETVPPDVSREAQKSDSEPTNRVGIDRQESPVKKPDDIPVRRTTDDQYPTSPVIATQDSPVSSTTGESPVDTGQADRPVSQSVPEDAPAAVVPDDSANTRQVQPPPPSDPVRSQPLPYEGPSRGTLVWTGDVVKGDQVVIQNESANRGTVQGALPGVPCTISLNSPNVAVSEAPGPRNRYRRLGLRFNQKGRISVVVTWEVIK